MIDFILWIVATLFIYELILSCMRRRKVLKKKTENLQIDVKTLAEKLIKEKIVARRMLDERVCPFRVRGYGCNLCYNADVVKKQLGMRQVYCVVKDSDCRICTKPYVQSSCTREWYENVVPREE